MHSKTRIVHRSTHHEKLALKRTCGATMSGLSRIQCLKTSNGSYIATDTTKDFRLTKQHPEATQYLLDACGQTCSWWGPQNDMGVINPTASIWYNVVTAVTTHVILRFFIHALALLPRTRSVLWSHPALWKVPHEDLFTKGSWNEHSQFRRSSKLFMLKQIPAFCKF